MYVAASRAPRDPGARPSRWSLARKPVCASSASTEMALNALVTSCRSQLVINSTMTTTDATLIAEGLDTLDKVPSVRGIVLAEHDPGSMENLFLRGLAHDHMECLLRIHHLRPARQVVRPH